MSEKDTPEVKLPGLYESAGVFQIRVMVPLDLRAHYNGRTKLIESLGTTNRAEAERIGTAQRALRLAEFDGKRKQATPQLIDSVSPELSKVLAQRIAAAVMGADDSLRGSDSAARLFLAAVKPYRASKLRIGPQASTPSPAPLQATGDPLVSLDGKTADELAALNADLGIHSARLMSTQRIADVLPLVKAEARAPGLEFDEKAPDD